MTPDAMAKFNSFFRLVILLGTKISSLCLGQETDAQGYDPEASITGLYTGPYFDPLAPRNFTAHVGDQAILPCTVRQLGDKSVSWVRMRDADILTVDRYTFVGDERFESHYSAPLETWNLVVKYVQERDAGLYECQVSTEPKMSQFFSLRVVIPKVEILPPGDRYVKAGSEVRIECQITDVVQLPDYIFWYHEEKRVMDHLDPNLVVEVKKTGVEAITSTLTIQKVPSLGSGNYTCMPSNLHTASVILHVLNEKHPAAMQGERSGCSSGPATHYYGLSILCILAMLYNALYFDYSGYKKRKEGINISKKDNLTSLSNSSSKKIDNQLEEWNEKALEALFSEEDSELPEGGYPSPTDDKDLSSTNKPAQEVSNTTEILFPGPCDEKVSFTCSKTAKFLNQLSVELKSNAEGQFIVLKESSLKALGLMKPNNSISTYMIIQPTYSNIYDQKLSEVTAEDGSNTDISSGRYRDLPRGDGKPLDYLLRSHPILYNYSPVQDRTYQLVCR